MTNPMQPRDPAGRFGHVPAHEADIDLGASYEETTVDPAQVLDAGPDEVDQFVYHDDWQVRADATANPHLTQAHLDYLSGHDQPLGVRAGVALSWCPGAAQRASKDPSPTVRALAAERRWDMTPHDRERLAADPAVARINALISA